MGTHDTHEETWGKLVAARTEIDRMTIERANNRERIACLERENEALREMVACITSGGPRAVL